MCVCVCLCVAVYVYVYVCVPRYGNFTVAVMKLLHCVNVPATADPVLFIDGTQTCALSGWQVPLVAALALLALTPLVIPFATAWAASRTCHSNDSTNHRRFFFATGNSRGSSSSHSRSTGPLAASESGVAYDVALAVRRAFSGPYTSSAVWWEAALMAQRFLLAALFAFGVTRGPGSTVLAMVVVCNVALAAHVTVRPLRRVGVQHMQTVLLLCLGVVACCSGPFADAVEAAGDGTPPSESSARVLTAVFGTVVPGAAVVSVYLLPPVVAWHTRRRQRGDVGVASS